MNSKFFGSRRLPIMGALALTLPLSGLLMSEARTAPTKLHYNKDIRPILAENCFACHGPDSAARKADLRLDRPTEALANRNGRSAIVKGNPIGSEMIRRVTGVGNLMPPPGGHKKLSDAQISTLKRWIAEGAEYEKHWAYIAPFKATLPLVKNTKWVRNPIDKYVLADIEKAGLTPAPEADRRTLARRLSLDLTGLPPDTADVEAFVKDKSTNYYEAYVDKLMSAPQWGEHRGRYWLDAARYADTHGIHFDNFREIWAYRDWVIKAFNKNMPFDAFTIEQLAGDLMPKATLDQIVATGFNRCNITSNEGGAIDEEYKVLYARDRTETTSQVWLGSTLGCAVCHDHKFDPFSQKDFYALSAFFNNNQQNAMDGNIKDTPPVMFVPQEMERPRFEAAQVELAGYKNSADGRKTAARTDFDSWLSKVQPSMLAAKVPTNGLAFYAPLNEGAGKEINAMQDGKPIKLTAAADPAWVTGHVTSKAFQRKPGSTVELPTVGDFEKDQSFSCSAWVKLAAKNNGGSIVARMDDQHEHRGWDIWVEGNKLASHIISKWPEDALKVVTKEPMAMNKWHHVCIVYGGKPTPESLKLYVDGTLRQTDVPTNALKSTIKTTVPFKIGQRHTTSGLDGTAIQDVRVYSRALSDGEVNAVATGTRIDYLATKGVASLSAPEKDELFGWWLTDSDSEYRNLASKVTALDIEINTIRSRGTSAYVMHERSEEAMAYLLYRGDYDKRRDKVTPATPVVLPGMPANQPVNRLTLAKWLMQSDNPLTARVTVNRFWQELFGSGIVRTTGDFGVTGEMPSNQALLDYMAVDFRENGWDVKKFFKMLVTSATYRQSAVTTPEKRQKDPNNRLLAHGPRFRMDAEMVRDYALEASGLLVKKLGGPSVKPYQPEGVWEAVAMIGSNTRDYVRDKGENLYRRSMYTFWKRAAPPASLDIFNAPNRETCAVRRERTDTPLQALVTLNDVQYVEAARVLAQNAMKAGANDEARIDFIAYKLLLRPLSVVESPVVKRSLNKLKSFYSNHAKDSTDLIHTGESMPDAKLPADQLAALTMLCNQMMNLDEVLNK